MIKIEKDQKIPSELESLTDTELFHTLISKKPSFNKAQREELQKRLNDCYHEKCAYCESKLEKRNNQYQIEHYRPLAKYWWLYYEWSNLLWSCLKCNGASAKSDKFPLLSEDKRITVPFPSMAEGDGLKK